MGVPRTLVIEVVACNHKILTREYVGVRMSDYMRSDAYTHAGSHGVRIRGFWVP